MKYKYLIISIAIILAIGYFLFTLLELPYIVRSRAKIHPAREWTLTKVSDGQLSYTLNDNFNNSVSHYSVTEFQRGDHGEFRINENVFANGRISKGDTIGIIKSIEEQRRLIELQGELDTQKSLLKVYLAGERSQDIAIAQETMLLAEKELDAQQKLAERARKLFQEKVIPEQEYELARNEYEVKERALQIARAQYDAVQAGAKPEQLELIRSEIRALESQIQQIAKRLDAFTIKAPFSGMIVQTREPLITDQPFVKIADDSTMIAVLPVEVHHLEYVKAGQKISLVPENRAPSVEATISSIGNSVQLINRRQNVFITAVIDDPLPHILPGMIINAEIKTGTVSLKEYALRIINTIYAN